MTSPEQEEGGGGGGRETRYTLLTNTAAAHVPTLHVLSVLQEGVRRGEGGSASQLGSHLIGAQRRGREISNILRQKNASLRKPLTAFMSRGE